MKLVIILSALLFSFAGQASEFCNASVRVHLPSSPWLNTSELKESQDIYKTIREKGFTTDENADYFISFQHGSYEKKKIAMGGDAIRIDTYIITRLTVKNAEGKILYSSDKDKFFNPDHDMAMKTILLMKRHIKALPNCSKLSK